MAFEDYLETIKSDSDGENVSSAISNALLYLTSGAEPIYEADVTEEATTVASSAYGKDVKGAIYSALKKISDSGETSLIIIELSQAEYDALEVKDQTQVYGITDNPQSESPYEYKYSKCYLGTVELERIFIGDTQVWGSTPTPPGPAWDETKIAVVKLDLDDEMTDEIEYFDTWESALIWMNDGDGRQTTDRFLARFGNEYSASTISSGMRNSQYLKHVKIIGGNATTISGYAFGSNVNLESIDFGDNVQTIDELALYKMGKLVDVKIGSGIASIASSAFSTTTRYAPYTGYVNSITIAKPEGSISGAPWGATNASIAWTG